MSSSSNTLQRGDKERDRKSSWMLVLQSQRQGRESPICTSRDDHGDRFLGVIRQAHVRRPERLLPNGTRSQCFLSEGSRARRSWTGEFLDSTGHGVGGVLSICVGPYSGLAA